MTVGPIHPISVALGLLAVPDRLARFLTPHRLIVYDRSRCDSLIEMRRE
jgi:hypothetical protein